MATLVLALQLLASALQCNQGTTYDMRECWDKESAAASAALKAAYAAVEAAYRKEGLSTAPLVASQASWANARDKMCTFEYDLYLPGTIAPQLSTEYLTGLTNERIAELKTSWIGESFW